MDINEVRKIFKENTLLSYSVLKTKEEGERIVFIFDNGHSLVIKTVGHPGINHEWDESVIVEIDEKRIISMLS